MEFITLFFTTALVFVFQKILQFVWERITPEKKDKKKGIRYGKK